MTGSRSPSVADSLREYGRGLAGGLLFSLPLLYTMEVWWAGYAARPERLLVYTAFIFILLLGYNRYAGIRHDASWLEVVVDSVEEYGLGVLIALATLFVLSRIGFDHSSDENVGQVLVEAGIVAIGFSVGTAQLGGAGEGRQDSGMGPTRAKKPVSLHGQGVMGFCGAVLFAANVAPTEEVLIIAIETPPQRLIAVAAGSMLLGTLVLYFSDFTRAGHYSRDRTSVDVIAGSVITYAIGLVAGAAILWFFGRLDGLAPDMAARLVVVLGLPATLGASAGRLLLQS
jgi:putative integral membrane protein (TIGR02587 family)